jgi:3-phenylpropionate/trans-cinnamate dioxygenase ferredoxin reductase subunit
VPGARTFVVVGASLAGGTAAATLREDGFDGRLVLIGDEPSLPYERPGLSKAYLRGAKLRDELLVRPAEWWEAHDIETRLGCERGRSTLGNGPSRCPTGSVSPSIGRSSPPVSEPHAGRSRLGPSGVYQLRTVGDADAIRRAAAGARRAVVVGMGFIGAGRVRPPTG